MVIEGYIREKPHSEENLNGINKYIVGTCTEKIHCYDNFAECIDGKFLLSTQLRLVRVDNFGIADTPEEADKRLYEHAKNILTRELKARVHEPIEFKDETKHAKTLDSDL